jgi:uncharacterized protein
MENKWVLHKVHVIPGSKLNQLVGYMDDGSLKIKLRAKPIEGKANKELVKYLSEVLEIKTSEIEIDSGFNSRNKTVRIWNVEKSGIQLRISA